MHWPCRTYGASDLAVRCMGKGQGAPGLEPLRGHFPTAALPLTSCGIFFYFSYAAVGGLLKDVLGGTGIQ